MDTTVFGEIINGMLKELAEKAPSLEAYQIKCLCNLISGTAQLQIILSNIEMDEPSVEKWDDVWFYAEALYIPAELTAYDKTLYDIREALMNLAKTKVEECKS